MYTLLLFWIRSYATFILFYLFDDDVNDDEEEDLPETNIETNTLLNVEDIDPWESINVEVKGGEIHQKKQKTSIHSQLSSIKPLERQLPSVGKGDSVSK